MISSPGHFRNEDRQTTRLSLLDLARLDCADSPVAEHISNDPFTQAVSVTDTAHRPSAREAGLNDAFLYAACVAPGEWTNLRWKHHKILRYRRA